MSINDIIRIVWLLSQFQCFFFSSNSCELQIAKFYESIVKLNGDICIAFDLLILMITLSSEMFQSFSKFIRNENNLTTITILLSWLVERWKIRRNFFFFSKKQKTNEYIHLCSVRITNNRIVHKPQADPQTHKRNNTLELCRAVNSFLILLLSTIQSKYFRN